MARFSYRTKLPLFLFKSFFDLNVSEALKVETSAPSPVSSKLPVISIRKPGHITTPEHFETQRV